MFSTLSGGAKSTLLCLAIMTAPGRAHAQHDALAEALFRQAREAMKRGDAATACPKFAESQRLDPAPGTLLNLAVCERQLGRLATAWARFQDFVDSVPASDPRVAPARKALAELEPRLSRVTISVAPAAVGTVYLDGVELRAGSYGTPLPLDPGRHRVALRDGERVIEEKDFALEPGAALEVLLGAAGQSPPEVEGASPAVATSGGTAAAVVPARVSAPAGSASVRIARPSQVDPYRTAAYWAGGIGLAGLTAAGVFGVMAIHQKSVVDEECRGTVCTREGFEATGRGSRYLRMLDVTAVVGFVGLGTAGALWGLSTLTPVTISGGRDSAMIRYGGVMP